MTNQKIKRKMRTIKFRGKNSDGEWAFGYFYEECGNTYIIEDRQHNENDMCARNTPHKIDPETIGQYTGLKDKNGKEIYEGDILSADKKVIGYINGGVRGYCYDVVYSKPTKNGETRWTLYGTVKYDYPNEVEVIGNIHDNPELLKGGENA